MKTAIYRRPTSPDQAHAVDVTLGEGDTRTLSIHKSQHLYEVLDMALPKPGNSGIIFGGDWLGDWYMVSRAQAEELHSALDRELQHYLDFVNGGSGK